MPIDEDKEYADLKARVKKYQKAENVSDNIMIISLFLLFLPVIVGVVISAMLSYTLNMYLGYSLFGFGFALIYLVVRWKERELERYSVDSAEWLYLSIYPVYTNMEKYLRKKNVPPGEKEDYRKKAIKSLRELPDSLETRWTVGSFRLAKDAVGTTVSDLIDSLRIWAIPTLEKENKEQMKYVDSFVTSLYWLSKMLNLEELKNINSRYKKNVDDSEKKEKGLWDKIKSHKNARWLVPVAVIILLYLALLYHLMTFWKLDFTGSSAGIAALFAVIFAAIKLFKEKKD